MSFGRRIVSLVAAAGACTSLAVLPVSPSAVASTPSWTSPLVIDRGGLLTSVSCPSASFCVAVDDAGNVLTYNGSSWSTPSVIDAGARFASVSCATVSFCAAVDSSNVFIYNGTTWSSPTTIEPSGDAGLNAVSCTTSTFCIAGDYFGNAISYSGTRWSSTYVGTQGDGDITGMSCFGTNFCAAVTGSGGALTFNGATWTSPGIISPPVHGASVGMESVSCASGTFCVAVNVSGQAFTYNGTTWSSPVSIDSSGIAISCPAATFCVASDAAGQEVTFNGSEWSSPSAVGSGYVYGISCPTAAFCAAVDAYGEASIYGGSESSGGGGTGGTPITGPTPTIGTSPYANDIVSTLAGNSAPAWAQSAAFSVQSLAVQGSMLYVGNGTGGTKGIDTYVEGVDLASGAMRTVAGNGQTNDNLLGATSDPSGPATQLPLASTGPVTADGLGDVYLPGRFCPRKIDGSGTISDLPLAECSASYQGQQDSGSMGMAADSSGNLYVADVNCVIHKLSASGSESTITPSGTCPKGNPQSIGVDGQGNVYESIAYAVAGSYTIYGCEVVKISPQGTLADVAGNGTCGDSGDGGAANQAEVGGSALIGFSLNIAVDPSGNLFIADAGSGKIRKVATSGILSTVACGGEVSIAVDANDDLYLSTSSGSSITKVDASGNESTLYGGDQAPYLGGANGPAVQAQVDPSGQLDVTSSGDLYFAARGCTVDKISSESMVISQVASLSALCGVGSEDPIVVDSSGDVFFADAGNCVVRRITPSGSVSTIAGTQTQQCESQPDGGDGGLATTASFPQITGVALDPQGNLYIADLGGIAITNAPVGPQCLIKKVTPSGTVSTFAGTGTCGYSGDGGAATSADIVPLMMSADSSGDLYIYSAEYADSQSAGPNCIALRKITPAGTISTVSLVSGTCISGSGFAWTPDEAGQLSADTQGDLFLSLKSSCQITEISSANVESTVGGSCSEGGDGALASSAGFAGNQGVAVSTNGTLFVDDTSAGTIREISLSTPTVASVSPSSGSGSGGTTVTIAGTNLSGTVAVDFGPVSATSFTVMSSTQVTAVAPSWLQGRVDVVVQGPGTASPKSAGDSFSFTSSGTLKSPFPPSGNGSITNGCSGSSGGSGGAGYWMLGSDGSVHNFGSAGSYGNATLAPGTAVGMAATADGKGYWVVSSTGTVSSFGDAGSYSLSEQPASPVVAVVSTRDGKGYWIATSAGQVSVAGDAPYFGQLTGQTNAPVVAMAATPDSGGYWLLGGDGGVFTFGDAGFFGSTGSLHLNAPAAAMASTADGKGYWFVAIDGGIFAFGDATYYGSVYQLNPSAAAGGANSVAPLNKPVVGIVVTGDGKGYWTVASDGGVFTFGDAGFVGSLGGQALAAPIVAFAPV